MEVAIVEVDVAIAADATRASRLIGADVRNEEDELVGTIDDLMLVADEVTFAILSVGGFLGLIGAHLVAIPFGALVIDEDGIVFPGATREELKRLQNFKYRD